MAGLLDFVFGSGPLKKAAKTGDAPAPAAPSSAPPVLDMAKLAQQSADKQLAKKKKKPANIDTIQKLMASSPDEDQ